MTINESITFPQTHVVPKAWGSELVIMNRGEYCGKILRFNAGAAFSDHYHLLKTETWYVLSGLLRLGYYDLGKGKREVRYLAKGEVIHVPAGNPHQLTAMEDSEIIEVSTEHFDYDSYRISPSSAATPS